MKKLLSLFLLASVVLLAGCHTKKESPYDRNDPNQEYERFLNTHIFAACQYEGKPYALYSLAELKKRPSDDNPSYKVKFVNGPCKGKIRWTEDVILKTASVGAEPLPKGSLVLRNYWNPKEAFDKEKTDRWHIGVVSNTSRRDQGILDLEFPRDRNDFIPAREGIYMHNVRHILLPQRKDVRTFL